MIAEGYGDARTIERRIKEMQAWVAKPELMAPVETTVALSATRA
jgi:aconitate hydratase 2/2-methylisocitrate dehydratase